MLSVLTFREGRGEDCGVEGVSCSLGWALSREHTLVMPAVLTIKEDTLRGGEVLT